MCLVSFSACADPITASLTAIGGSGLGSVLLGAAGSLLASSLFGGDEPEAPTPQAVEKPKVMPLPDDDAIKKASERTVAKRRAGAKGRDSTILTSALGESGGTTLG